MREFDIESIGKKMPYASLPEDFFEKITANTLGEIERRSRRRQTIRRITLAVTSIAAAVALFITIGWERPSTQDMMQNFDDDLDLYVERLSDDEINALLSDMEFESEFYANL